MKHFLQSIHKPEVRFEILEFDKSTGMAKLKGQMAEFEEPISKERMEKYGYKIVKEDEHENDV